MTNANVLDVTGLSVSFGGVKAVNDVSFHLKRGEILGIIGPNGAGKTTVFDAISGFVGSTGKVVLDGVDISGKSPEKRSRARLGRSFQDAKLFPSLTVFETLCVAFERHVRAHDVVSTALSLPWVRKTEKKVAGRAQELIELMGLTAFRDKFISELSTGSRRIVDLAVIMAHDPLVLLLDEPSSGIAQKETEALGPLLLRIREQTGCSLLVIEHDMPLITGISDEILALETGAVLMRGTADVVLNDPRLVSAYLGTDQAVLERSGKRSAPAADAGAAEQVSRPTRRRRRAVVEGELVEATVATSAGEATVKADQATVEATKPKPKPKAAAKRAPVRKPAAAKKQAATKTTAAKKSTATRSAATKKTATKKPAAAKKPAAKKTAASR